MEQTKIEDSYVDMLGKIYDVRQEELQEEDKEDRVILKSELNGIELEKIEEIIKSLKEDISIKEKVIKDIQKLVEDYELKIAYYSEKNYKIGFKDAFSLCKQCEKQGML